MPAVGMGHAVPGQAVAVDLDKKFTVLQVAVSTPSWNREFVLQHRWPSTGVKKASP